MLLFQGSTSFCIQYVSKKVSHNSPFNGRLFHENRPELGLKGDLMETGAALNSKFITRILYIPDSHIYKYSLAIFQLQVWRTPTMCTGVSIEQWRAAVGVMAALAHRRRSQKPRRSKSKLRNRRKRNHLPKESPMLSNHIDYGPENKQCTASSDSVLRIDQTVKETCKVTRQCCKEDQRLPFKAVIKLVVILFCIVIASTIPVITSRGMGEMQMNQCENVTQNYFPLNVSCDDSLNTCPGSDLGVVEHALLSGYLLTVVLLPLFCKLLTPLFLTGRQAVWDTKTVGGECALTLPYQTPVKSSTTRLSEYVALLHYIPVLIESTVPVDGPLIISSYKDHEAT